MTAPDRIFALIGYRNGNDVRGEFTTQPLEGPDAPYVTYIRRDPAALAADDLVKAMIGAAVEEAAKEAAKWVAPLTAHRMCKALRALHPDALAALERVRQEAEDRGIERAAVEADARYAEGAMGNPGHWIRAMKGNQP